MNFEEALKKGHKAYGGLGHQLGNRFLYSQKNTFKSEIIFLNLNPGGDYVPPNHPWGRSENGPAQLTEAWNNEYSAGNSPLQVQVLKLFSLFLFFRVK